MDARLQRRVQRYGWDLAATDYEPLWRRQLAVVQTRLLDRAALVEGERVLDVACGTGLVALAAARTVGAKGRVCGVDISGAMVEVARHKARQQDIDKVTFARMDAESLAFAAAEFDVALCALGLMYMPDPALALREMRRVLRPGGRLLLAVWGERKRCGWSTLFEIVQGEVASEVCPLFFRLGQADALAKLCSDLGYRDIEQHVIRTALHYADADEACRAAFAGGPVALAWSRLDEAARARACARYLDSIASAKVGEAYDVPVEFLIVSAVVGPAAHERSGLAEYCRSGCT